MNGFKIFVYCALVIFACIGGMGYCFWVGEFQFGFALLALGVILGLAFFKVISLPTADWIDR